jgi:hypothetical protein
MDFFCAPRLSTCALQQVGNSWGTTVLALTHSARQSVIHNRPRQPFAVASDVLLIGLRLHDLLGRDQGYLPSALDFSHGFFNYIQILNLIDSLR